MRLVFLRLVGVFVACALSCSSLEAVEAVYRWPAEAANPVTPLVAGADGAFYGLTRGLRGDTYDLGEAVRVTATGEVSVIDTFASKFGGKPTGLFLGTDGKIYGTTSDGGENRRGVLFRMSSSGGSEEFWSATEPGGELKFGLVQGDDGMFYGITEKGGAVKRGAIFRISPEGRRSVLASISDLGTQGAYPSGPLLNGDGGVLFGACAKGGPGKGGLLFEVTTAGVLTTIHSFDAKAEYAPKLLLRGSDGSLYGTVSSRQTRKTKVFRRSTAGTVTYWDAPGVQTLAESSDGHIYATTKANYWQDSDKVLKLTSTGEVTEIVAFDWTNGAEPLGLTPLPDGELLGVTASGGNTNAGVLFKISPAGEFTHLHSFGTLRGHYLKSGVTLGADGSFYGVMKEGGLHGQGTIFRLTPEGQLTVLHAFNGEDGAHPRTALLLASDGALYGTAEDGGAENMGTIFKITADGQFSSLFSFSWEFGGLPSQALIRGDEGILYGTTRYGGKNGSGGVYAFPIAGGAPRVLTHFPGAWGAGDDGCLALGNDGSLYGLGQNVGYWSYGPALFYRVDPNGGLKVLHTLSSQEGAVPSGLTLGPDGAFYGTCRIGGIPMWGSGTIFRITTAGQVKVLRSFSFMNYEAGGSPSQLTFGSDGNFYGTTGSGGFYGSGLVFKMTPTGEYRKLRSIDTDDLVGGSDEAEESVLTEGPDGNLYGNYYLGLVYRLPKEPRPNRAPIANADRLFIEGATSKLAVLENDLELDGDAFQISAVTQGAGGVVEISRDKKYLSYHPNSNFTGTDQFSYEVSDGRGGVATTSVVVRSWSLLHGTYSLPLLKRASGDVAGRLELRLSGNGVFTGKAFVSGRVIPVRGKLDSNGIGFVNGAYSVVVFVEQSEDGVFSPKLYGSFSILLDSFDFRGGPVAPAGVVAGRYTVLLRIPELHPPGPALPKGSGWGVMTVKEDGSVISTGQLPDGTPFSTGGWLTNTQSWMFSASARRRSLAFGEVSFADIPQESDASATLTWSSGATWRGAFPLGFDTTTLRLIASRYVPPANTASPLVFGSQPAKADVVLSNGDLVEDYAAEVTFTGSQSALVSGVNVETKLRIDAFGGPDGLWLGSFLHPAQVKQKRIFKGVVFQKQNLAEALFIDRTQTGRVTVEAR